MLSRFLDFVQTAQLLPAKGKTLLAVSGGVDSVVLCHLFKAAQLDFAIAHCNFNLRAEAAAEEQLVAQLAQQLEVAFWKTSFATAQLAKTHKKSIQELARSLRYDWLQGLTQAEGFSRIATAHHLNDSVETLLYNLTKGCGIRGLHGIPVQQGQIIRPLLFASKAEIRAFAQQKSLVYAEDASNAEDKYARNLIRNQVVPVLKKLNPSLEKTTQRTIQQLKETESLFLYAVEQLKTQIVQQKKDHLAILLAPLLAAPAPNSLLYEWLKPYHFHLDQIQKMVGAKVGSQFFSRSHRLIRDREALLLSTWQPAESTAHLLSDNQCSLSLAEGTLHLLGAQTVPSHFVADPRLAWLDFDRLQFPLQLRRWQAGDYFQPLGMQGKKKLLQDFFSNQKLSLLEKEKTWVLTSGEDICWIVGQRIDHRYKVTDRTQRTLALQWETSP